MKAATIHTKKGTLKLIEPGIIKFTLKADIEWTLEDAKETHAANLKLSNGGKFCVFLIATRFFVPSKEAQHFIASKECTDYRVASAFIVRNHGLMVFANLFIQFFKSKTPIRIFKEEEEALKWMRELYQKATRK